MDWTSFILGVVVGVVAILAPSALLYWWLVKPESPKWPSGQGAYDELKAALGRYEARLAQHQRN